MADTTAASAEGLSKSAKKRAAKKARDAAHAEEDAAPPPPPPEPKAKAKAAPKEAAKQPEPKAKGKAKAEPAKAPEPEPKAKGKAKAKAAPLPEPPAPQPKAKAKAEPKAEPKAQAKSEPKSAAKAQGKQKAKPQKAEEVEEAPKEREPDLVNYVLDDGSGPSWEVSSGLNKKAEKRKQKQMEIVQQQRAMMTAAGGKVPTNTVVGMGPISQAPVGKAATCQAVAADVQRILAMKNAAEEKAAEPAGGTSSVTITVPEPRIGVCIGPKGSTIKMLQEKSGGSKIDVTGNIFTVTGPASAVSATEAALKELIDKGYCSMSFEGFSENMLNVHPSSFPDLIGKGGAIVKVIKEELKVEVNFQDVPKGSPPTKKGKVTLAGSATNVEKAKEVINDIIMYGHHEITHPGLVHEELDVEPWAYRYIIGSKGSELKHIQHNWKVVVKIPRETSANDKVLIVGEADQVARVKTYLDKLIWNAENNAKGRDRADNTGGDPWGDEEEEEAWMKPYLYKR